MRLDSMVEKWLPDPRDPDWPQSWAAAMWIARGAVSEETHSLPLEEGGHQGRVARRSEHAPAGFRAVRAYWLREWGSCSENKKACYL